MIRSTKRSEIVSGWHLIDARGQVLGRLASKITPLLLGKRKSYFVRNLDCGDNVVVINAKDILVTGKKETNKFYYSYSGYPGGLKKISFQQMREKSPGKIVINAVSKMLPQNKLREQWLKKLHVFAGGEHKFNDKFGTSQEKIKNEKRE